MTTQTLTGYLGGDPEKRDTEPRTEIQLRFNPIAECHDEIEYTTRSRQYLRLSLATHRRNTQGKWQTTWHQLVLWSSDRLEHLNARLARKGDKVTVQGHEQTYTYIDKETGQERQITRFIITSLHRWPDKRTRPQMLRRHAHSDVS